MAESAVGVAMTITRQKAGSTEKMGFTVCPVCADPDGVNAPRATICAETMFAAGSERLAKFAHASPLIAADCARVTDTPRIKIAVKIARFSIDASNCPK